MRNREKERKRNKKVGRERKKETEKGRHINCYFVNDCMAVRRESSK